MCGLVGMFGNIFLQDAKAFRNLLRLDVLRGEDSTGIAYIPQKTNEINLVKELGTPEFLFFTNDKLFDDKGVFTGPKSKLFLAHNRFATKGKVNKNNAHPFHHDNIVGAHNGTLDTVYHLEDGYNFDVDSEAIFYNLSIKEREDVISKLSGAYALTWYDSADDMLYIIRNKERPLFYTRRKDNDVMYWASEDWMLDVALGHAKISHSDIKSFDVDTLYSFSMKSVDEGKHKNLDWGKKAGVKGYNPPYKYYKSSNYSSVSKGGKSNSGTNFFTHSANSSPEPSPSLTKEEIEKMKSLVDEKILFRFDKVCKGYKGMEYLRCYHNNPNVGINIRVFPTANKKGRELWEEWSKKSHRYIFSGRVRRYVNHKINGREEHYLLLDLRSIEEFAESSVLDKKEEGNSNLPFVDNDDELDYSTQWFIGFNGNYLTHDEWIKSTRYGCACCSQDSDEEDDEIVFIADDEFICGECASLPIGQQYAASISK